MQRLAWGKKKKKIQPTQRSGRQGRRLSEQKPRRVQPGTQGTRSGSHAVGDWSEDVLKACRAKLRSHGTCREGHVRDVGLHEQKRGWARGVTWIAGRRLWSRYGKSPRRRNVRDCGREDDGVGLPRRALRAVALPRGVLCTKRADYEPNIKLSLLSHSRFT